MLGTSKIIAVIACGLVLCAGATSFAGVLNGHASAYNGWTGTVPFNNGLGLSGTLDYAVFTASAFNNPVNGLSGLGYVPGDSLVYTYQLFNSDVSTADAISAQIVGIVNPASTIGAFNIGNVAPSLATFSGGNALWMYNPAIPQSHSSWGMAFSSPNVPMSGVALTIDGGGSAVELGIPTPSAVAIPEPGSLALWTLCSGAVVLLRRRMG